MSEDEFVSLLKKFTDEELEDELKKRKDVPYPLASEDVNIAKLSTQAREYLDDIHKHGRPSKDAEHYMFETVMITFYGSDVFDWIRKHNTGP